MKRFFLILYSFFPCIVCSSAQEEVSMVKYDTTYLEAQRISEEDLTKFRDDSKFDYDIVKSDPTWWDNFKTWFSNLFLRFFEWIFGVEEAVGALAVFVRVLPYVLLAILLFLLIKFFLSVNSRAPLHSQQGQVLVTLSEEEHIIKNEDIQKLVQRALSEKNYRLAVRYYYLYILQLLSEKELIDWQLQKTNHDYESEIEKPDLKSAFTKITRLYDYVWYGDFGIDEKQYKKAAMVFSKLQSSLKNG